MKYQHFWYVHSSAQNNPFGAAECHCSFQAATQKPIVLIVGQLGLKTRALLWPQVSLLYPQPGYVEIDPDTLWSKVVAVVKEAISGETFFQS